MKAEVSKLISEIDDVHLSSKIMLKLTDELADLKITTGESLTLRCEVTTTPAAVFYWEKDGKIVQGDTELNLFEKVSNIGKKTVEMGQVSSTFNIPCATQSDAGLYKCVAVNGHRTVESQAEIQVEGEDMKCPSQKHAAPQITQLTEARFELSGNVATLVCRSDRRAHWAWQFDGKTIDVDQPKYELMPQGDLLIRDLKWEDMGDYVCIASNRWGESRGETFLYPTKPSE
ncbi:CBN-ZIG-3 protein [Caenorhabditis brenneri]|uniref:CBN-ZIG-3 protein n=1 Tax=Caenorhabditis brenneri TaxID=135651 RepID=G0MWD4_CAEBE|nr:CBN-ZIG-3 protein [Caenorhabditis brenneri]